jgi:hypothetical protein
MLATCQHHYTKQRPSSAGAHQLHQVLSMDVNLPPETKGKQRNIHLGLNRSCAEEEKGAKFAS